MTDAPTPAGVPVCYRHPGREAHIRCQRCERPICPDCMTSASVGFQCPECLREGRRTQRQPSRTTGLRLGYRATPVMWTLIGINVLVWLLITVTGGNMSAVAARLALWPPSVDSGDVWQVVTSIFTHVAVWHIAVNMLSLYMLGSMMEAQLGSWRFLAFYMISGLAGSVLVLWVPSENTATLGASGALFGLMGILAVIFLKAGQGLQPLAFPLLINFGITFWPGSGISWQAHVGGFVGGIIVGLIATYGPWHRRQRIRLMWAAQGGFACLLIAAVGVWMLTHTYALASVG